MKHILKHLIDEGIIDFNKLVLKYYHKFDLNEREAMALLKLFALQQENEKIIQPKKFAKWLRSSSNDTENILSSLIEKVYLIIHLSEDDEGKECESFNIDYFLTKVFDHIKHTKEKQKENTLSQIVDYLEDILSKPLNQLDLELIKAWVFEEQYDIDMIKTAANESLKRKYPSLKTIDHILRNQLKAQDTTTPANKEALKEFYKLWEE